MTLQSWTFGQLIWFSIFYYLFDIIYWKPVLIGQVWQGYPSKVNDLFWNLLKELIKEHLGNQWTIYYFTMAHAAYLNHFRLHNLNTHS